jgi:hypothetical protein
MYNIDSVFMQQVCGMASRNWVSAGLGSYWEFSGAEWGILGKSAGPLHEHKGAFHVHGNYAERKIAGVAGEGPIADATQAIASASSWRERARRRTFEAPESG